MSQPEFIAAVAVDAVAPDTAYVFNHAGRSILICNSDGGFFAVENRCSHAEETLECGRIRNGWISCPAHGARFDLETGEAISPPAKNAIITFAVRVSGKMVEIAV